MKRATPQPNPTIPPAGRWWLHAAQELLAWAICCAMGYAVLDGPLLSQHWPHWVYGAIGVGSLLVFSRLARRLTFFGALAVHAVHPGPVTAALAGAAVAAWLAQFPLKLCLIMGPPNPRPPGPAPAQPLAYKPYTRPRYESLDDCHVYPDGRRTRAFLVPTYDDEGHDD